MNPSYFTWPPQFTKKEIQKINKFFSENYSDIENEESAAHSRDGVKLKHDSVTKLIRWKTIKPYLKEVYGYANYILTHDFGFLTYPYPDDKFVNHTTYTSKSKDCYRWHLDQSGAKDKYDIKGTLLINVSEETYTGGKLKVFHQGNVTIEEFSKPGSMVLFHGFINHEVTPITKGTRKTIAMFIGGPTWR